MQFPTKGEGEQTNPNTYTPGETFLGNDTNVTFPVPSKVLPFTQEALQFPKETELLLLKG